MKSSLLSVSIVFLLLGSFSPLLAQDVHLREPGTSAIFQRSAFVHGYRHGYDEGYHLGNIDINMGRHPRTMSSQFHDASSHYTAEFGSKKYFEAGFQEGLKAGYGDGFLGRKFRAVEDLRWISHALDPNVAGDPGNAIFDAGIVAGYNSARKNSLPSSSIKDAPSNFQACSHLGAAEQAQTSFCDGYHRGRMLGEADALARALDFSLTARK